VGSNPAGRTYFNKNCRGLIACLHQRVEPTT
jgi:hypothetical protein